MVAGEIQGIGTGFPDRSVPQGEAVMSNISTQFPEQASRFNIGVESAFGAALIVLAALVTLAVPFVMI
jgi:hypothetical protein